MNDINQQATNDVRELLGELVVSPVSTDMKRIISNSEETLTELIKEITPKINNVCNTISIGIKNLPEKLGSEYQLNDLNENIQGCEDSCKKIKQKVVDTNNKLTSLKDELAKLQEIARVVFEIEESIQKTNNVLSKEVLTKMNYLEDIRRDVEATKQKTQRNFEKIQNIENVITNKIDDVFKDYSSETKEVVKNEIKSIIFEVQRLENENVTKISSDLNEIKDIIDFHSEQLKLIIDKNDKITAGIKGSFDDLTTLFNDNHNENVTKILFHLNKNKMLFYTLLILSIINSFGIAGIICILFF